MFKFSLFTILALMMCLTAVAGSFIRTHEDYILSSEETKNQIIIKTMELAVELEAIYQKDTKKFGYNKDRYEKYVQAIQYLSSFFIDSAYAGPTKAARSWETIGKDFNELMNFRKNNKNRCIFAGWVSETAKNANGKTVCAHPDFILPNKEQQKDWAKETYAYPDPKPGSDCLKNGKQDPDKIQCSPLIFGYKSIKEESLLCVKSSDGAENSSYHCMKAALSVESNAKTDSKETRLNFLRNKLATNKDVFNNVQKFVFKTCVCSVPPIEKFDKEYHAYIRPHRTCYGLMEMMAETVLCENPKLPMDTTLFVNLRNAVKDKIKYNTSDDSLESEADSHYKFFLDGLKKSNVKEYQELCPNDGKGIEVNKLKPISGPQSGTSTPPVVVKPETKEAKKELKLECGVAICSKLIVKEPAEKAKTESSGAASFTCTYEVNESGKEELQAFKTPPTELPKTAEDKTIMISGATEDQSFTGLSCPISWDNPKEEKKEDKPEEKAAAAADGDPTFSVKITKTELTSVTIKATFVNKGESVFSWSIKDLPADSKIAKGWEGGSEKKTENPEKTEKIKGIAEDSKEEKEEDKKDDTKKDEAPKAPSAPPSEADSKKDPKDEKVDESKKTPKPASSGHKDEIQQARTTVKYQVCGNLKKADGKALTPQCVTVEAMATAVGPFMPPQGGPPPPIRRASDASAMGIR